MRKLVLFLAMTALAHGEPADLERLEAERRELEGQLTGKGTFKASATAAVEDELPRLEATAREKPSADALVAYATALAAAGRFKPAQDAANKAMAVDPKHELAARTARELGRFDGGNGPKVIAALTAVRDDLARREEVDEARRTLPGIAKRAANDPSALLELAATQVVLEDFPAALEAARKALAVDAKNAIAAMLVDELTRQDPRGKGEVRTAITMRWLRLTAGPPPAR